MSDQKRGKPVKKEQKNENIQVFVRVRPASAQEKQEKCGRSATVVECSKDKEVIVRERSNSTLTKTFTFDRVFAPDSKQIDVYKNVVHPLIDEVLAGYNCTVFAYGQTGTGKTFTMEGERSSEDMTWEKDPQSGIVPRVLNNIFDELRLQGLEFTMGVSYLELYNEELIDLLSPVDDTTKLRLFEDANQKGTLVIQGLQEILVLDKKEVYDIMKKGSEKRQTAATMMNAQSSRSHTIFTVTVHIRECTEDGEELLRTGKINLVDLAGSENIGRSGAKQQRAREAGNINQSLLTLGRVITALVERTPHVPYRESKLTRLLQDSLGGRTKTSIIATISPVLANIEETLSTLDYAHRAKSITNRPEINQRLTKKALLKEYTTEIERLRRDLEATRDGTGVFLAHDNYVQMMARLDNQDSELGDNVQRIRALEEEREKKEAICDRLNMELEQKIQELDIKTQILKETQSNLAETREELYNTEEQRDETQELLNKHVETEQVLGTQAATLLTVADQSTTDLQRVHDKLDRKRSVERENSELVQSFQDKFSQRLARMKENSQIHTDEQTEQLSEISKQLSAALENIHTIEMAAHSQASTFLESHGQNIQILEGELRSQAEARQQWSTEQIQAEREHVTTQISALQAAHVQAQATMAALTDTVNQLGNVFSAAIQSALQQVESQAHHMQSHTLKQVEQIASMNQQVLLFTQQVETTLQQQQDEIHNLKEHDRITSQIEEEERSEFNDIIKKLQLLQEKQTSRTSRQNEKTRYYDNLSNIIERQETMSKESAETCEQQLNEIDKQNNILLKEHEHFASDLKKTIKSISSDMSQGFESLLLSHQSVCSDMSNIETMVEKGWQQHSEALEQQLREHAEAAHTDLQAQATQLQALKLMGLQQAEDQSSFAEARQKSLGEHMEASQRNLNEHSSAGQEWSAQHNRELFERAQEVQAFLNQEMKCDQPTGQTPQRRTVDFPRTLKATSPHDRILQRFRANRQQQRIPSKCQSVDSVLGGSDGDATHSISQSTSLSSLSSPENENTISVEKENTNETLTINSKNTKFNSQKSPIFNKKSQSTKRKVLTNQN